LKALMRLKQFDFELNDEKWNIKGSASYVDVSRA
jgi:hypothetical protein